ncbi:Oxidoreductase/transition metal ion-binding protein [Melia azedarach]|uniref:Oxidoreductase/transition metal ion-binding protein n=1 Tax=Melia azedarach TaxID=155640 RepID=A0ACC1YJV1_MELAZ|nr:Oxidoreductase/transition metal ion-binding protein [Melia azedarach]
MARNYYNSSYLDYIYSFSLPLPLFLFTLILFFVLGFSWYINYESVFEDFINQVKFFLMLSPLLLLLLVHCLSGGFQFFVPLPAEKDSLHRAGGSPFGVAALLVFLLFMVSYQSSLHERWFPLITK